MANIYHIKPLGEVAPKVSESTFKIFLAGSIEMDKADQWQEAIVQALTGAKLKNDIIIYNPRREKWNINWKQGINEPHFKAQVTWELNHINAADLVVFFFQPGTLSPISLNELGVVSNAAKAGTKKVIVLCPEGFYRKGNVDIECEYFGMDTATDMSDLVNKIIQEANAK